MEEDRKRGSASFLETPALAPLRSVQAARGALNLMPASSWAPLKRMYLFGSHDDAGVPIAFCPRASALERAYCRPSIYGATPTGSSSSSGSRNG